MSEIDKIVNTSKPLHTNNTKKIVFVFAFLASAFFNVSLFGSVGFHLHTKIIYGLIGLAAVYFQTLELRNYYNTKKKKKYIHLIFYIICTIASIAGTLGAGWAQIEKSRPTVKQTAIENSTAAIDNALKKADNQWAVINLLNKKKQLEKTKADIKKTEKNIVSSLNGIANIFKTSQEKTAFVFLIFVAMILELMIFGSATYNGKLLIFNFHFKKKKYAKKKLSKIERELRQGQGIFNIEDFRKVG
jgi:hypothetical protein